MENPFSSFWMAGYECSDQLNAFGHRVDMLEITSHNILLNEDYESLSLFDIRTVREGIQWNKVEKKPYVYDWSQVERKIDVAKQYNIQQVWDICHFGFPDDLTPLHPMFAARFGKLCRAFVEMLRSKNPYDEIIITPINEVSFLSWLGGHVRGTSPYCINLGWEVKYALMRAYIEGVALIKEFDPSIKILSTDPVVNMVPPLFATEEEMIFAQQHHEYQYQVLNILCGRICPELGGKEEYLDIIGVNYYYNNQWICEPGRFSFLPWANNPPDERWKPLHTLINDVYLRYNRPTILAETSHSGEHRPQWINAVTEEIIMVLKQNIPFWGICIYPILDRPDWDNISVWHHSGLWDANFDNDTNSKRILNNEYAEALVNAKHKINSLIKAYSY